MPAEPIHQECTSLQERVSAIEVLLNGKTFITGAPVQTENGYDLGYVQVTLGEDGKLTTSKEQTISINHGITPEFNVTVGPDPENPNNGKIYWLINGKPMLDASGNPVEAPKDGKDAPEPTFHIWDGVLCYTFDQNPDLTDRSKNTWYELQNVIGPQGPVGPQGPSGLSITTDENGKVTITYDHDANPDTPAQTAELPTYSDFMELYNQVQDIQANIDGISTLVGLITGGEDGTPQEFITDYRPIVDKNGIITGFQFQTVKYVQNAEGNFEVVASGTKTVQNIGKLISLEQDPADGKYYWVLPDGTKLPVKGEDGADAAQPQFCIVNGHLWYTLDENPGEVGAAGHKWQDLGSVAALLKDEGSTDTNTNKSLVTITRKPATDGKNEVLAFTFGTGEEAVTIEVPTQGAFEELIARVAKLETKINTLENLVRAADNKLNSLAGTMRVIHSFEKITDQSGKILKGFKITWKRYEAVTDADGNFLEWKAVIEKETEEYLVDDTISLAQDENGSWYWVINSFDINGNVIESVQIPFETEPQLKVIDGILYVALVNNPGTDYNDPTKWMRVQMPKESTSQQSLISIKEDGNYVIFTFAGNPPTEIKVPSDAAYKDILKAIDTINSNLVNLQKLVDEINARAYVIGTEPYNVDGIEKGQYIKFSDGTNVLIKYGEKGDKGDTGITPKFKINNSGYWMVSYDDGQNYDAVTNQAGDFVRATPKLRIHNGYWQVSYNIDEWDYLLDENRNQIPASGADGDTVFAEEPISAGEDKDGDSKPDSITITLADDTTYTIPTWDAFVVLKNQVEEINTTVSTFSRLLSGTKFIQNIAEFTETTDGKTRTGIAVTYVSYDPSTGLSDPVTEKIYDGSVIGIIQDPTDGKYYWTIDGDYLLDKNKNKVLAKGEPGADAPIPSFSIGQNGHLMMTVTINGVTTTEDLGDVTGESGSNGAVNITWDGKGDTPPVPAEKAMSIKIFYGEGAEDYIEIPTQKAFIELQEKVTALEQNVSAIQALLRDNQFVKDVEYVYDDNQNIVGVTTTVVKYVATETTNSDGKTVTSFEIQEQTAEEITYRIDNFFTIRQNASGDWEWVIKGKGPDGSDIILPADGSGPRFVVHTDGSIYVARNKNAQDPGIDPYNWLKLEDPIEGETDGSPYGTLNRIEENDGYLEFYFEGQTTPLIVPTQETFQALTEDLNDLQNNVTALEGLISANTYISEIEPVTATDENGHSYVIGFDAVMVKYAKDNNGNWIAESGYPKTIGYRDERVTIHKNNDGLWEWWIQTKDANGNPVTETVGASGAAPKFGIYNGHIYAAVDPLAGNLADDMANGKANYWYDLGLANPGENKTQGATAGNTIKEIFDNGSTVTISFTDGSFIVVPTQSAFETLQGRVSDLESEVQNIHDLIDALEEADYVIGVAPKYADDKQTVIGYILDFKYREDITIYHGQKGDTGADGSQGPQGTTPLIGVQEIEGIWYWTVDGTLLMDSQNRPVQASGYTGAQGPQGPIGVTPKFKIEDGQWYVSYDNGETFETKPLGPATGEQGEVGDTGASLFESVEDTGTYISITLSSIDSSTGAKQVINIPKWYDLTLIVSPSVSFEPGDPYVHIPFTITGMFTSGNNPEIASMCEGAWSSEITNVEYNDTYEGKPAVTGQIEAVVPDNAKKGKILLFVTLNGQTVMKTISIVSNGQFVPTTPSGGIGSFNISTNFEAKNLTLSFATDAFSSADEYYLESDEDWAKPVRTKAPFEETVALTTNTNPENGSGNGNRTAKVAIKRRTDDSKVATFTITQTGLTNLSENGNANCYIVDKAGDYRFAPYKGNSTETVGKVSSYEVMWQTTNGVVEKYDVPTSEDPNGNTNKSMMIFKIADGNWTAGNALIAAKDASGTILWSWHLWMASGFNDQTYAEGVKMMDRNLGAENARSAGTYYQWGRKDPFILNADNGVTNYVEQRAALQSELDQNPTTFYKTMEIGNWSSETKTIYDPCPRGYMVPSNSVWTTAPRQYETNNNGAFRFMDSVYYPVSSYINSEDGKLVESITTQWSETYDYLGQFDYRKTQSDFVTAWSASLVGDLPYYIQYYEWEQFYKPEYISRWIHDESGNEKAYDATGLSKSNGMNVRCVREK